MSDLSLFFFVWCFVDYRAGIVAKAESVYYIGVTFYNASPLVFSGIEYRNSLSDVYGTADK